MKKIENTAMLITYPDTMGKDLATLDEVLDRHFKGVFGGVHILPFFPSSGDRGFAVINYDSVHPAFGTWDDIDRLGEKYYLMADFMLNHVSIRCAEFKDYMKNGDDSPYKDMFIDWNAFWPDGEPTEKDLEVMYRRKEKAHTWNSNVMTERRSGFGTLSSRNRWILILTALRRRIITNATSA